MSVSQALIAGAPPPAAPESGAVPAWTKAELYDLFLEATLDGVMDWDLQTGEVVYSDRWKGLFGFEPSELPDRSTLWTELSHPEDLAQVKQALDDHLESFWPFCHTWRMRHRNGDWRWVTCRTNTARDRNGRPLRVIAAFTDVTERVRGETRVRALLAAIPDLLLRVQHDGTLLDYKPADDGPLARVPAPAQGRSLAEWPLAQGWVRAALETLRAGDSRSRLDSVIMWEGQARQVEVRVFRTQDEGVFIVRDVTEQRKMEAQLLQAQKLEAIGALAAGVAHEINTPTQYVTDNVVFLRGAFDKLMKVVDSCVAAAASALGSGLQSDEVARLEETLKKARLDFLVRQVPRALEQSLEGLGRVSSIVSATKEFSSPDNTEKDPVDLHEAIRTTLTVARSEWHAVADVVTDFDPALKPVVCHRAQMNQVLLNLLVNAAQAISERARAGGPARGTITVRTRALPDGLELQLEDTGTGIAPAVRDRVFEPFFSTKEVGRGTGLGLALARSIVVEKHGGSIHFETEVDRGTCFVVRLPASPTPG